MDRGRAYSVEKFLFRSDSKNSPCLKGALRLDFLSFPCILPGEIRVSSNNEDRTMRFGLNNDAALEGLHAN